MKICFLPMVPEVVEMAYEEYRSLGLQDSPSVPFAALPDEQRRAEVERAKAYRQAVEVDGQVVGWIGIRPREELGQIHIGFGLFERFRGNGLMKPILQQRIKIFVKEEYPQLAAKFPTRELLGTAEISNLASIRTLEGCGFVKTDLEPYPPGFEGIVFRRGF